MGFEAFGDACDRGGLMMSTPPPFTATTTSPRCFRNRFATNCSMTDVGGRCLDVAGGSAQNHAQLILASCSASASQQWSVQ